MITVTLYRKPDCEACDSVQADLNQLQEQIPHRLVVIDLSQSPDYSETFAAKLPVVEVGPYHLQSKISMQDLQVALGAARDRHERKVQDGDASYLDRIEKGQTITGADKASFWLSRHYMLVFNAIVLIYMGIPFLAPVLMKIGWTLPAKVIYTAYSPLCHQYAFRSWFLFGEQPAYPRALAGVQGMIPYGQATGLDDNDYLAARKFIGNEQVGYKVALCERDVAIYGSIFLFGVLFALTGRRLKSIPWFVWLALGIVPIGVDGFSQLLGSLSVSFLSWIPLRESTPALRTLTGGLFGFTTAWYGYPYVEETMEETRRILGRKLAVFQQSHKDDGPSQKE